MPDFHFRFDVDNSGSIDRTEMEDVLMVGEEKHDRIECPKFGHPVWSSGIYLPFENLNLCKGKTILRFFYGLLVLKLYQLSNGFFSYHAYKGF